MIDEKKICGFLKTVVQNRENAIAVYGIGNHARMIGKKIHGAIACFCDGKKQCGNFLDKPIKPINELPQLGIDTLVIAASLKGERIVYERIGEFCKKEGISLYSAQSGELMSVGKNLSGGFAGKALKERLWECIESHDVISFDIFDTLLMRKVLYPTDVFDLVEQRAAANGLKLPRGFKNYRNQAEVSQDREGIGLDGIYATLKKMINLTDEEVVALKKMEMEAERDVLMTRPALAEAGRYAKSLGKKVLLVSDMYLPPMFLEEVLSEKGIEFYDKIYISDYYGTSKGEGLFKVVREENPAETYMHIGDNQDVDGWGARRSGIDSFTIKSALEAFRSSGVSHPFKYMEEYNERLLLGLFLTRAYLDPFVIDEHGKRHVVDIKDFAGLFVAPLAASFVSWLLNKARERGFEAMLFASRDGYAFKKMYDEALSEWKLSDMPPSVYLHLSRKLCLGLAMREDNDLEWMHSKIQGKTRQFVNEVFKLEIAPTEEDDDSETIWETVLSRKEEIFNRSKERSTKYKEYLHRIGLRSDGNYAFVDMCSQGTSQYALTEEVLRRLCGMYFKRYNSMDARTMGQVESFLPQDSHIMLINNVFEFIFSSPEPSVNDVDNFGNIVFNREVRNNEEMRGCMETQEVIMRYWSDFLQLAIPMKNAGRSVGQQILDLYRSNAFPGGIQVFEGKTISDDLAEKEAPCLKKNEIVGNKS